jgi:adenine-specific DNA-methyltransferase
MESGGHLLFTRGDYGLHLTDIAFVKVGAVSGADDLYASEAYGNRSFVCSATVTSWRHAADAVVRAGGSRRQRRCWRTRSA